MNFLHRTWAEIDLDALKNNYNVIRQAVKKDAKLISVVKADAYGHGAVTVAKTLSRLGTDMFAVSNIEEAVQLRGAGIGEPILILGYTPPECAACLSENGVTQSVFSLEYAAALSQCAQSAGVSVDVHIKLDTGMHRIGFVCDDEQSAAEAAYAACILPGLNPTGVFTHFASADLDGDRDGAYTRQQYERFIRTVGLIEGMGVRFQMRHCCNSAAIFTHPEMQLDAVRPGIILYGLMPSGDVRIDGLRPVMSLKTVVSMTKALPAGMDISYGRTYTTPCRVRVATVPIGYADGYVRANAGRADMLIRGRRVPVVGRVCMDQCMLDVSGLNVVAGDTVTVFGRDGDEFIPIEELAGFSSTINYEVACLIGKRVTRVFIENGRPVGKQGLIE